VLELGFGGRLGFSSSRVPAPYVFTNAEASALVARMTTAPTRLRKQRIDTLVGSLKTAGVWAKLDALYVMAAHDAQAARLNWIADVFNLTAVSAPTFTADRGYAGDGSTSYLDTGFNPATASTPNYVQDSAHYGWWVQDGSAAAVNDFGNTNSRGNSAASSTSITARINGASGLNATVTDADRPLGWTCVARPDSANMEIICELEAADTTAIASQTPTSANFFIGCFNSAGSPSSFSTRRYAAVHFGEYLDDTERDATRNALSTYLQAVGAASADPDVPTITNGTFDNADGWTLNDTGGTASVTIGSGTLNFLGGSDPNNTWAEAEVSGVVENDTVTLQYEVSSVLSVPFLRFTLGGGANADGAITVGTHTVELTCGASGTNLRVWNTASVSGRDISIDNLIFI